MADIFIRVRGAERVQERLQQLGGSEMTRTLHERIGLRIRNWVVANVEAAGLETKWAPLRPSTVYGRRMSGKSKGPQPLRNTNQMMQSLSWRATATEARVGFGSKVAVFHQWGTSGPYTIAPRFKQALAFPSLWTRETARQTLGSRRFAGLFRSGRRPAFAERLGSATVRRLWLTPRHGARRGAMGRMTTFQQRGRGRADMGRLNFMVVKSVQHPGLPARPLLPSPRLARELAAEVARNFIRDLTQGGPGRM
jgi:phage gpG-like protein